jgi:hypothetical protein
MFENDAGQGRFSDNVQLFGSDPVHQTEKFNLYKGLALLAATVRDLNAKLDEIESELNQIKHYQHYQTIT